MSSFPVITSTLSAAHLAVFLQQQYALGKNVSCRLLKAGINHSYLVNTQEESFVFRVYSYNWRTEKEITEELKLIRLLHDNRISVSYPIADTKGSYLQQLEAPEGRRTGVLFSFAQGEKMLNFPASLHYTTGTMMAKMHAFTRQLQLERITYTPQVLLADPMPYIKQYLPANTPEMAFMEELQQYLLGILSGADTTAIRQGVVHMDIWFDNLHISQDKEITFFDFDFCGNGWLCNDIAYYILQIHSTEKDSGEYAAKKESFLQGYESVTPISSEEKRMLPALGVAMYFFYLGIQCRRYDNWSNNFLNEIYLKRFINLLIKKWAQLHQMPVMAGDTQPTA